MIILVLGGCGSSDEKDSKKAQEADLQDSIQTIGKAQKIEVQSADDSSVLRTITEKADIEAFVDQLKMNDWEYASVLPEDAKKQYKYVVLQENTVKSGEKEDEKAPLHEAARLITYEGSPYVTLKLSMIKINMKIPDEAAEYLDQ